ncbi:MAG: HAD family hydrolase [Candidatus Hodarchaeales archaeon]|jgi:phosphoglycolate phosphatase
MQKSFTNRSVDTIIFDVDGTLFNGQSLSLPIFKNCLLMLIKEFNYDLPFPSDKEILSQFGKQADEIYADMLVNATPDMIKIFGECVEKTEITRLKKGQGELFNDVPTVLNNLKKRGYKLAICTNARKDYFRAMVERFQFNEYFQVMLAAGLFIHKDKNWMVQKIIKKLKSKNFAVVGDRHHDIDAAKANNGISVGCAYGFGFGEVEKADFIINDFQEMLNIFR